MPKKPTPKNLYVRGLVNERISIGEYINGKWRNAVDPFRHEDDDSIRGVLQLIRHYECKTGRICILTPYQGAPLTTLTEAIRRVDPAFLTRHKNG